MISLLNGFHKQGSAESLDVMIYRSREVQSKEGPQGVGRKTLRLVFHAIMWTVPGVVSWSCQSDFTEYRGAQTARAVSQIAVAESPKPDSQFENHWFEAESSDSVVLPMATQSASASAGAHIWVPTGKYWDPQRGGAPGSATYRLEIKSPGIYTVWGLVHAPTNGENSFHVRMNGDNWLAWHIPRNNGWTWGQVRLLGQQEPLPFFLAAGSHHLEIAQREGGTKLDRLVVTNDPKFAPSEQGATSEATKPSTVLEEKVARSTEVSHEKEEDTQTNPPPLVPVITTQPTPRSTVKVGETVKLEVVATSAAGALRYQWEHQAPGVGLVALDGATGATLTLANIQVSQNGQYRVKVGNEDGATYSHFARVTVQVEGPPVITGHPRDESVAVGRRAKFFVSAVTTLPAPTVAWWKDGVLICDQAKAPAPRASWGGECGGGGEVCGVAQHSRGHEAPTSRYTCAKGELRIDRTALEDAGTYHAVLTNVHGNAESNRASLQVRQPPVITRQPALRSVVKAGATVKLEVEATSTAGALTYQWEHSSPGVGLVAVDGATGPALTLANIEASQGGQYRVKVSNTGSAQYSHFARVTVQEEGPPVITSHPRDQSVIEGRTRVYLYVSASTTLPAPTVVWWKDGVVVCTSTKASGAHYTCANGNLMIDRAALEDGGTYHAVLTNVHGSVESNRASLQVQQPRKPPVITTQPVRSSVAKAGATVKLEVVATSAAGALTYQWERLSPGVGWVAVDGATGPALTLANIAASQGGQYLVKVGNEDGVTLSHFARVTVQQEGAPVITSHPSGQSVVVGRAGVNFYVSASTTLPAPTVAWWKDGGLVCTSTEASAAHYTCTNGNLRIDRAALEDAGTYHAVLTNVHGSVESNRASLQVRQPPVITTQSAPKATVKAGETLKLEVVATSAAGALTYQWQYRAPRGKRIDVDGATGATLTLANIQPSQGGEYRVKVSNEDGETYSRSEVTVLVEGPVVITRHPSDQSEVLDDSAHFSVAVSNTYPPPTITWRKNGRVVCTVAEGSVKKGRYSCRASPRGALWFSDLQASDAGVYDAVLDNGRGAPVTSNPATLRILQPPEILLPFLKDVRLKQGETLKLTVNARGDASAGALRYQWQKDGIDIPGATDRSLIIHNIQPAHAGRYQAIVSNNDGSKTSLTSSSVLVLSQDGPPVITRQPEDETPQLPYEPNVYHTGPPGVTAYFSLDFGPTLSIPRIQWRREGVVICDTAVGHSKDQRHTCKMFDVKLRGNLSMGDLTPADVGTYDAVVSNKHGSVTTRAVKLLEIPGPPQIVYDSDLVYVSALQGERFAITREVKNPKQVALRFEWSQDGQKIEGADGPTLVIENVQAHHAGRYRLEVRSDEGEDHSSSNVEVLVRGAPIITSQIVLTPEAAVRGEAIQLRLGAETTYPRPNVQWRHNGTIICDPQNAAANDPRYGCSNGYKVEVIENQLPNGGFSKQVKKDLKGPRLDITSLAMTDSGTYEAILTNEHGSVTSEAVSIVVHLLPPLEDGGEDDAESEPEPEIPSCVPRTEICDGVDNDCNGQIDDLPPGWCDDSGENAGAPYPGVTEKIEITAGGESLCAYTEGETTVSYHTNHLASVEVVTNADGKRVERIAYKPYGGSVGTDGLISKHASYTGQELDEEIGLYDYKARLYDPELGRFISADTVVPDPASPQTLNRYAYVYNNPINFNDPTGHTGQNALGGTGFWGANFLAPLSYVEFLSPSELEYEALTFPALFDTPTVPTFGQQVQDEISFLAGLGSSLVDAAGGFIRDFINDRITNFYEYTFFGTKSYPLSDQIVDRSLEAFTAGAIGLGVKTAGWLFGASAKTSTVVFSSEIVTVTRVGDNVIKEYHTVRPHLSLHVEATQFLRSNMGDVIPKTRLLPNGTVQQTYSPGIPLSELPVGLQERAILSMDKVSFQAQQALGTNPRFQNLIVDDISHNFSFDPKTGEVLNFFDPVAGPF